MTNNTLIKTAFMHKPFDLRIEDAELPKLKPNQVLVKVGAVGICGSDVSCYEGKSDEGRYDIAPYTPGHEYGGKIIEVGDNVLTLKPGDKVTGDCVMGCGVCENCKDGLMPSACLNMREVGFRPDSPGAMSEYMVIEEEYVHRIPDDWSYEMGAWVETFSIGYFGIWGNGGYIDASDTALIIGGGPVGLCAAIVAKTSGAKVIVADPLVSRRKLAKDFGAADVVLDPTDSNYYNEILKETSDRGPSVIAEASGSNAALESIFDIAGHSCRVGLIGHSIGRQIPLEIGKTIWKTLRITGSGGTKDFGQRTIRFMSAIKDKHNFESLVSHRLPFEQLQNAMDIAVNDKENAFKVMLKFEG